MDLYRVLNVSRTATASEIKVAFRKLALKFHPDRADAANKASAEIHFKSINHAYQVLSDDNKRAEYDLTSTGVGSHPHAAWNPQRSNNFRQPGGSVHVHVRTGRSGTTLKGSFNTKEWNAWHYGDDAVFVRPVVHVHKVDETNKHRRYWAKKDEQQFREEQRQKEKDMAKAVQAAKEGMKKKRQQRLDEDNEPQSSSCTIS